MTTRDVILAGVVGSTAYGLAGPDSDIDTLGIYRAAWADLLGLSGPEAVTHSDATHEPDITLHEVGKYIGLALKCNPTILELLWLDDWTTLTDEGQILVAMRGQFLSEQAVRGAYGKYAAAQVKRLVERRSEGKDGFGNVPVNRIAKHARHVGRLVHMGGQLLATGEMQLDCSNIRDELFVLGELAVNDEIAFMEEFRRRMQTFDEVKSMLPQRPNRALANDALIAIRLYRGVHL